MPRVVALLACLGMGGALVWMVEEGHVWRFDRAAYFLFVLTLRNPALTQLMEWCSALASPVVLLALLLTIAAFVPGRRPEVCAAVNLVAVTALDLALKAVFRRERPSGYNLIVETGWSFPSGHSMVAMAFFGLMIWFIWTAERERAKRWLLSLAFAALIVAVGVSRIYLGVHYASDVIGGFACAIGWLLAYTRFAVPAIMGPEDGALVLASEPTSARTSPSSPGEAPRSRHLRPRHPRS
jgi:membrane-associated phospholipid phosphatase